MAFRVPNQHIPRGSHQQSQQAYPYALETSSPVQSPVSSSHSPFHFPQEDDDTREWVLFSPTQEQSSASIGERLTHTTSTERTPRISDFGSIEFGPRFSVAGHDDDEGEDADLLDEENNTELDSLDDGLHAFREPSAFAEQEQDEVQLHHSEPALLPAHDGLGTFHASSINVQEQLWQHERFNPARRPSVGHRRLSSFQRYFDQVEEPQPRSLEHDRWQRIEQWRMEQSEAVLEEISKENTRKRRNARSRRLRGRPGSLPRLSTSEVMGDVFTDAANESRERKIPAGPRDNTVHQTTAETEESLWMRITRKVIKDLMGLDDSVLSLMLGESLMPIAEEGAKADLTSTEGHARKRKVSTILEPDLPKEMDEMLRSITSSHQDDAWWQETFLDRIARELGDFVHHIYDNPPTFSTYTRAHTFLSQNPPSSSALPSSAGTPLASRPEIRSRAPSFASSRNGESIHAPNFIPTLQDPTSTTKHAESWGIEEGLHATMSASCAGETHPETTKHDCDREYWERDLDIGVVFNYLWKRLAGKLPLANGSGNSTQRSHDPSKRAAMIRRNHPLVARAHELASTQSLHLRTQSTPARSGQRLGSGSSPILYSRIRRSSLGCASQSTKTSISTKKTVASGSSRHYWDIGGSVGSNSAILAVGGPGGGLGNWGDL